MAIALSKSVKESKVESAARTWVAKPILGTEYTEDPPLQDVYVGLLKHKKNISAAIQSLSAVLPGFGHLKRCSANKMLLAAVDSSDLIGEIRGACKENGVLTEDELRTYLIEKEFDLSLLEEHFQKAQVPSRPAKTKAQAARMSKIWPANFHPDPFIESIISGSILNEKQLRLIEHYVLVAIEAAKLEAVGDDKCTGSAVVVDPEDGRILAVAASKMDQHPMWHAAMLAIDLVATLQGGGAWNLRNDVENETKSKANSTLAENNACSEERNGVHLKDPEKLNGVHDVTASVQNDEHLDESSSTTASSADALSEDADSSFEKRTRTIKRKYAEEAPLYYPENLSSIHLPVQESLKVATKRRGRRNNDSAAKSSTPSEASSKKKTGPYLCTGYWVFLLQEPCPVCAMALLHSRVKRVFYGATNERAGILGSNGILHALPGLNHRYLVWGGILEHECRKVLTESQCRNVN